MTQAQLVLNYMQNYGSITTLEAFRDLGVTRLSGVIFELKKEHAITSKTERAKNRYGENTSFSRYFLADKRA